MRCVPWKLPAVLESEETEDCNFQIPYDATHAALTVAKSKIAGYRRRHGARAWTHAVARVDGTHVFGGVRQPISRAYCKLIELIETCILPTPTASLHLCEAPGPPPPPHLLRAHPSLRSRPTLLGIRAVLSAQVGLCKRHSKNSRSSKVCTYTLF